MLIGIELDLSNRMVSEFNQQYGILMGFDKAKQWYHGDIMGMQWVDCEIVMFEYGFGSWIF